MPGRIAWPYKRLSPVLLARAFCAASTALFGMGAVLCPTPAQAREQEIRFDIRAQDLASALQELARQGGVQILFPYAQAAGKRSHALRGSFTLRRALERLLADQGVAVVSVAAGRISLGPAVAHAAPPHSKHPPPLPTVSPPPPQAMATADIIVAGRAVSSRIEASSYSYAVSVIDWSKTPRAGGVSVTEMLRMVPGFWVESSGGESSNNVRSRGIPTDGFTSITLAENGIPIQYDGGLGYLNTDQSFRLDETVARVEVVRGGPSALFMPNAPGGVANIITRTGLRNPGGLVRASLGDHDFARLDAVYGARIAPNLGLMAGGFYRRDGGRRRLGYLADEGGQARIGLDYEEGGNRLSLDLRHLDDRVTFYLPVPLRLDSNGGVAAIAGFDPLRDSLSGPQTLHLPMLTPQGVFNFDLTRGTLSKVTELNLRGRFALGKGIELVSGASWRTSDILRNALFPVGQPTPLAAYLDSIQAATLAAYPRAARLVARYAADGAAVPADANGNGLVQGANLLSVHVPLDEWIAENRISWQFDEGGHHALAVGLTLARYSYRFDRTMGTVLLDVRNGARLVDAVALDAAGSLVGSYTDHGFSRYGSSADKAAMAVDAQALYLADEWQIAPRLRLDFGGRWERNRISGHAAGKVTVDLGNRATLADDQVLSASGAPISVDRAYSALAWSLAASYSPYRNFGLFARYTHSFRLPSASEFNTNPARSDENVVPIRLAEAGLKFARPRLNLAATAFYTRFDRLPFTDYRFDTASNAYAERTAIAGSETLGLELEARLRPTPWFELALQTNWQKPRYRNFAFTELISGVPLARDYSGHQLIRVPELSLQVAPAFELFAKLMRVEFNLAAFSQRFSDVANTQRLPPYALLGGNVTVRLAPRATLTLQATNLTNTLGLTEGNPRSGSFETGSSGSPYFLARPEFARSIRVETRLDF